MHSFRSSSRTRWKNDVRISYTLRSRYDSFYEWRTEERALSSDPSHPKSFPFSHFWATVCKTVRPILSDCCHALTCPVCLYLCNVGVFWPNGWMDQDATRYGGKPWPRPHCVRWRPSSSLAKGNSSLPHFSAHIALARSVISATAELLYFVQMWKSPEDQDSLFSVILFSHYSVNHAVIMSIIYVASYLTRHDPLPRRDINITWRHWLAVGSLS